MGSDSDESSLAADVLVELVLKGEHYISRTHRDRDEFPISRNYMRIPEDQ